MNDKKIIDLNSSRGSSVNKNNTKTYNTEHRTYNTTSAPKGTSKEVVSPVAEPPSVAGIRDAVPHQDQSKRQALEAEVVEKRKQRDKLTPKQQKFKDEMAQQREKVQLAKERDARAIINADYVHRIEVSMHINSTSARVLLNIDVLQEPGTFFQNYKAVCQSRRARDIMQSVPAKYADWEGYEYAKEAIRDGACAGKICLRQQTKRQTQIASKTIPCAVAVFNADSSTAEVLLGDKAYTIQLQPYNSQYFAFKGILQNEKPEEWMDL